MCTKVFNKRKLPPFKLNSSPINNEAKSIPMKKFVSLSVIPVSNQTDNMSKPTGLNHEGKATLTIATALFLCINGVLFFSPLYGWWSYPALVITLGLLCFFFYFFRDPQRVFPSEDTENVVVSPADGTVVTVEEVDEPDHFGDRRIMISVFMSVFSVHANWYPVNGTVTKVGHQDGNFHAAFKPKASTENERSLVVIETPEGTPVMMRQIAGALARRVVTYSKPGDQSRINSHMGFIKFGSRVDVYLPTGSLVCVKVGEKVCGDVSILAKLPADTSKA